MLSAAAWAAATPAASPLQPAQFAPSAAPLAGGAQNYTAAAEKDRIVSLPGAPAGVSFRMFSGYVPVEKDGSRKLFYWYVESQNKPETDPLMLWTNGGPGCSGLLGFLTEQGPFRAEANGTHLSTNPYAWNKLANMVFIEQPAGVGFSTHTHAKKFAYGDQQAASDNWAFIKGFVERYPHMRTRPFYISAESYGGHYIPTLAAEIVAHNKGEVNFKGFAVGNPLFDMPYNVYGTYMRYAADNMLEAPKWKRYEQLQCWASGFSGIEGVRTDVDDHAEECAALTQHFNRLTSDLDPYALDFPVCQTDQSHGRDERYALLSFMARGSKAWRDGRGGKMARALPARAAWAQKQQHKSGSRELTLEHKKSSKPGERAEHVGGDSDHAAMSSQEAEAVSAYSPHYEPCARTHSNSYLNRKDVRAALHIDEAFFKGSPWVECSNVVSQRYNESDVDTSMMPVFKQLVEKAKLNILVYSGDDDAVCASSATQQFIWALGYNATTPWAPYHVGGQVAGFTTVLSANKSLGGGSFRFSTVHGAGHMVPQTRPMQGLEIIRQFLAGQ